jgi:glycerate kinase
MTRRLAGNLEHLARLLRETTGTEVATLPRAGAAGGLAGGLAACLKARLRPGFEVVSEITGLEKTVRKMNLILTGEGHTDRQTLYGKVPYALALLAQKHKVPVVLFSGGIDTDAEKELGEIFAALFPINPALIPLEEALQKTEDHLRFSIQQAMKLSAAVSTKPLRKKNFSPD